MRKSVILAAAVLSLGAILLSDEVAAGAQRCVIVWGSKCHNMGPATPPRCERVILRRICPSTDGGSGSYGNAEIHKKNVRQTHPMSGGND